jgi:CMP-N-acetylneuraminic acid synthetase
MKELKIFALLPMKGNSERVPNKNLKIFCGKPLYHRVLNELLKSNLIDQIIINTDSEKIIRDVNSNFEERIVIHNRPKEIIGDFVSMNEIIANDLSNTNGTIYLQTHSTNPLLKSDTIDLALKKMLSNEDESFDSIFSVTKIQTRLYEKDGNPVNHNPDELIRTQDLPPLFEENSNFFIFTKSSFEKAGRKRIGKKPLMFEIDKVEAIDIDEPQDFLIAEAIFKALN